jgi:hypothetical protein
MDVQTPGPTSGWMALAATSSVAAALVTLAIFLPFAVSLQDCEGFGCLGMLAYWPIAIAASAVTAILLARRARLGWPGYGLSLLLGAAGFLATNIAVWELDLLPS